MISFYILGEYLLYGFCIDMDAIAKSTQLLDPTASTNVFDYIGFYAPQITIIVVAISLLNRVKFLAAFLLFYFVNYWVNQGLKEWIRQPRPNGSRALVGERYGRGSYGMPSYHSQKIWFAITFLYLVKGNPYWLIAGLVVASLTMYQRWKYKAHSLQQLGTGAVVGIAVAWCGYSLTQMYLKKSSKLSDKSFPINLFR